MLDLGTIQVIQLSADKVLIRDVVNGEGGTFPLEDLRDMVEKYFTEKF